MSHLILLIVSWNSRSCPSPDCLCEGGAGVAPTAAVSPTCGCGIGVALTGGEQAVWSGGHCQRPRAGTNTSRPAKTSPAAPTSRLRSFMPYVVPASASSGEGKPVMAQRDRGRLFDSPNDQQRRREHANRVYTPGLMAVRGGLGDSLGLLEGLTGGLGGGACLLELRHTRREPRLLL